MNDVFKPACQSTTATRTSFFKLSHRLRKNNYGQKSLSYVAPSIWNKLSDFLKQQRISTRTNIELKSFFFLQNEQQELFERF